VAGVQREATRHGACIEGIEPINLQHAGLPRAIGRCPCVLADKLDELANRRLVDLRAHVIFPPSLKKRLCRYLCCLSVGSRRHAVRLAMSSTNSRFFAS